MIRLKRIYESKSSSPEDGKRVFIDRLWPRGLNKEEVVFDAWMKDISPSDELRKWFGHDPAKWDECKRRYRKELENKGEILDNLKKDAGEGTITLLYSAKDREHNNAVVLKEIIE